jgi:MraZ protein
MFLGQYRHNIDEKGRLTIPARFRELLEEGAYVTQGFDHNLLVLTAPMFEFVSKRVNQMSLTDPTARELKRLLFSTADRIEPDKTGRILLPQFLRETAGLDGEAMLVGVGDYFEIWPPDAWDQQIGRMQDTEANAQRFAALDLSSAEL